MPCRLAIRLRFAWLALCLLLFSASALATERAVLFKIESDGLRPSYLLGTMHSEDERVLAVLSHVQQPLQEVDLLVLEMVPDPEATRKTVQIMLLAEGQTLDQVLANELYLATVQAGQQHGVPETLLQRLKPWAIAVLLSMPVSETGVFLDLKLYQMARERQVAVQGLETAEQQIQVFERLDAQQQIRFLRYALKNLPSLPTQLEQMTGAYLASDLQKLADLSEDQQSALDADLNHWFDTVVVSERNQHMWAGLRPMLKKGGILIAVGALHLVGDDGLLSRLRSAGYRVQGVH